MNQLNEAADVQLKPARRQCSTILAKIAPLAFLIAQLFGMRADAIVNGHLEPDARVTKIMTLEKQPDGVLVKESSLVPISRNTALGVAHSIPSNVREGDEFEFFIPCAESDRCLARAEGATVSYDQNRFVTIRAKLAGIGVSAEISHRPHEDLAVVVLLNAEFRSSRVMEIADAPPENGVAAKLVGFGIFAKAYLGATEDVKFSNDDTSDQARAVDLTGLIVFPELVCSIGEINSATREITGASGSPGDSGGALVNSLGQLWGLIQGGTPINVNGHLWMLSAAVNLRSPLVRPILERAVVNGADRRAFDPLFSTPAKTITREVRNNGLLNDTSPAESSRLPDSRISGLPTH